MLMLKKPTANTGDIREIAASLGLEDPLEEGMATHSSIMPEESHRQRSLVGCGS